MKLNHHLLSDANKTNTNTQEQREHHKSFIEQQFQKFSNNVVGQGIHLILNLIYDQIRNVF